MFQFKIYNLNRFLACWPDVLAQEGPYPNDWSNPANFSDTPGDPGGATRDGIIQTEYNLYLQANHWPGRSVRNITYAQGETIYLNSLLAGQTFLALSCRLGPLCFRHQRQHGSR